MAWTLLLLAPLTGHGGPTVSEVSPPDLAAAGVQSPCTIDLMTRSETPAAVRLLCLRSMLTTGPSLDDGQLEQVRSVGWQEAHDTGDPDSAEIALLAAAEWRSRSASRASATRQDYEVLVATGQWTRAAAVSPFKGDPDRTLAALPLPDGLPMNQAVYWQPDFAERVVSARSVNLAQGYHVVVYAAPGCGFCAQAIRAIAADGQLRELMRAHSIWVSTPDINFRWSDFAQWEGEAAGMPLRLLRDRRHWPVRRFGAIPWFFLVKDGRVQGEFVGWLADGPKRLRTLLAPLASLGGPVAPGE